MFTGITIRTSPYAETVKVWHEVVPCAIRKRRRGWRVRRREERRPAVYRMADGSFVMHPALYARLIAGVK